MASEDHAISFQNVSEHGVGEPGIARGVGCNRPPKEHQSSGWVLLQAKVVTAFPEISSDLAQAASVFRTPPAWVKAPPTPPCVIRAHSPCLLATLPCIRSLGPAFSTLAVRPISCFILGLVLCFGLSWPARGPQLRGDGLGAGGSDTAALCGFSELRGPDRTPSGPNSKLTK